MTKFQSPASVQRKLEAEFGKNTNCIVATFQIFCETGTLENRQHSGRSLKITEEKIDEAHDINENQQQTNARTVATARSISRTTVHRIITTLKPYKVQFVQRLDEEDF